MSLRFAHETLGQRVRFAPGAAAEAIAEEVASLGVGRVMVIASARATETARRIAAGLPVAWWHDEVVEHVPVEVAERARRVAREQGVDALLSVGGGSATGLAKAVALTSGHPVVAVPTTYAGSEATDVWGLTEAGRKTTGVERRVLPRAVVYDATLTTSLPLELTVASGLNALAHGVDSLWGPRADPLNAVWAVEGVRALNVALPLVVDDPGGLPGREQLLYGAYVSAVAFTSAGSGLHHKICHVLGGRYGLPHAPTHAVVLPHVLALNAPGAPAAERRLAEAFGSPTGIDGLRALRERIGAPRALKDLGLDAEQLLDAVDAILPSVPAGNPVPVTRDNLYGLLRRAWEGDDPR